MIPQVEGKKDTDGWVPVRLVDSVDLNTPEGGKLYSDLTAEYAAEGATAWSTYTIASADWKEVGDGDYWLNIGAAEWTAEGLYLLHIECAGCNDVHLLIAVRDKLTTELIDDIGTILGLLQDPATMLDFANVTETSGSKFLGQVRRAHAFASGVRAKMDQDNAPDTWTFRDEADAADRFELKHATDGANVTSITPSVLP